MSILKSDEYLKVKDLCIVYGESELRDYLNVARNTVSLALKQDSEIAEPDVKHIRSGIRQYWRPWMGAHRKNSKPIDKLYRVITVEEAKESSR